MTILENFGFKIFRLRQVLENQEFLLYDIETKDYNQYSEKRLLKVLDKELYSKGINYLDIAINDLAYPKNIKKFELLTDWIFKECKLIHNLSYQPSDEMIFIENKKSFFNIYKKSEVLNSKYEEGEFIYIKELLMNLVGNKEEEYNYFVSWVAWQIQNPLKRLPTSIILQGEHGTGKSKFCELILKKIFESNFCEIGQSDINNDNNDFILGKQIIVANEVIHNDNKYLVPDKLKNYVTDEYLSIRRKYRDTIYVKNYAQWIFVTNNDMPLKIEKGDRRYTIVKSKKLKDGFTLIKNLVKNLDKEINHFLYYLSNLEVDYDYVASPILNEAKKDIIKLSQNSVEEFIDYILEIGGVDIFAKVNNYNNYNNFIGSNSKGNFITTDLFYDLYGRFCLNSGITHKFTRRNFTIQLKKLGFESSIVKVQEDSKRVIMIEEKK